jgi:glycerophosphoryl diester phosphodiesterase
LENTIASMQAAFEAGADIVEIDVHRTEDWHFAVFHDWDVECRTDAAGKVETFTRAELKTLDIGHGYTADAGNSYPFRGQFAGAMPMLDEVFAAFPDRQFLINLKSNNSAEGEAFAALIMSNPEWKNNIYGFYGGPRAVEAAAARLTQHIGFSPQSTKTCLKDYALWGWSGHMPQTCQNMQLLVPVNYAPFLWGWPHKFTKRMRAAGSDVLLAGPYVGNRAGTGGINDAATAAKIPDNFNGVVWTDKAQHMADWLTNRD